MGLLDVLLPPSCAGCGRYGSRLCGACLASFRPSSPVGVTFVQADPAIVVGESLTLAVAAFRHEAAVRRALARLKYGGAASIAGPLARAARPALEGLLAVTGPAVLVPVPVHRERLSRRGYNQAALLATGLAPGGAGSPPLPVVDCLERRRATIRMHGLDRAGRLRNLRDAFALRPGARPPPVAIVVDDILTTAATLEACAGVLLAGGATSVYGFAIGREV
jgi:ComF family protein